MVVLAPGPEQATGRPGQRVASPATNTSTEANQMFGAGSNKMATSKMNQNDQQESQEICFSDIQMLYSKITLFIRDRTKAHGKKNKKTRHAPLAGCAAQQWAWVLRYSQSPQGPTGRACSPWEVAAPPQKKKMGEDGEVVPT